MKQLTNMFALITVVKYNKTNVTYSRYSRVCCCLIIIISIYIIPFTKIISHCNANVFYLLTYQGNLNDYLKHKIKMYLTRNNNKCLLYPCIHELIHSLNVLLESNTRCFCIDRLIRISIKVL